MTDFTAIFSRLPLLESGEPSTERIFSVEGVPGSQGQFLGRSGASRPAFLVEAVASMRAPIVLQNIRVTFGVHCLLSVAGSVAGENRSTTAVIIECLSDDSALQAYFMSAAGHALLSLGDRASPDDLVGVIDALVSLFQRLSRAPRRRAQGLFGELLTIDLSNDAERLVESWHSDPMERFDFALDDLRLEVKTSGTRSRRHEFSLEQCFPPGWNAGHPRLTVR